MSEKELSQEDWCKRFVKHMLDLSAPRDHFDDGELILDYATATAPTYWETDWQREEGLEACAEADVSYWGEE